MKLQYFGYALLTATTLIALGFMGIAVPSFRPGFYITILLLIAAAILFGLYGFKLIIAEQSYYSRYDVRKAVIPAVMALIVAGSLVGVGVFIAMRP